jgi:hypothetical protein
MNPAGMFPYPGVAPGLANPLALGMPGLVSSAAQFHQPAEKNQIKLFVGGLGF